MTLRNNRQGKRGEFTIEGQKDYVKVVLFKNDSDNGGVDLNPSQHIFFNGQQTVEVESDFYDEMYAFRYIEPRGGVLIREVAKSKVAVFA